MELWVSETDPAGQRISYAVTNVLHVGKSEFQELQILETTLWGRMMLLDGLVMITDRDEFVYHEMISHIPMAYHPDAKDVVVIGGGDGGTLRELAKYPTVKKMTLCEIDGQVIDAAKKFFPFVASGFEDPRVDCRVADGVDYVMKLPPASVDLMIIDSTDPIGPGEGLFSKNFYANVAKCLRPNGIMVCQSESPWHPEEMLQKIQRNISGGFVHKRTYWGTVPTYPRGSWTWTMAAKEPIQLDRLDTSMIAKFKLNYVNPELALAAFAIPNFLRKRLEIGV